MQEQPMNGFIIITSLIKHALHIKLMVMIMVLDALHKLNVKIVSHKRDVGHNKELKSMVFNNSETLLDNKI